jgi:hypothetical protein
LNVPVWPKLFDQIRAIAVEHDLDVGPCSVDDLADQAGVAGKFPSLFQLRLGIPGIRAPELCTMSSSGVSAERNLSMSSHLAP